MRNLFAALAGGLFGTGLLISGMTNTRKVQGWLDIFGNWDPTLAFVMGGTIVPMAIAWQLTRTRAPIIGGAFPAPTDVEITPKLAIGSVFFGMGWGLTGLCPGPAMASLGFGGTGGLIFLAAMLTGMIAAPKLAIRLDPATA
ncbi:MAG: hypothetical protein P8H53_07230 [Paracoccaceae bacterium]|jgi:uncharacterized protein|nr:hypothetical protein [Paracoccaceae bacterium]